MSGMVPKSQIPVASKASLPTDLQQAIIAFKNALRGGQNITTFYNNKPNERGNRHAGASPLPRLANGCCYKEFDVGAGRSNRGSRRIVAEVNEKSNQILEIYFTDEHYAKGSFVRLTG